MPAILEHPKAKAPTTVASDPRYRGALGKFEAAKGDLAGVRNEIAKLKAHPVGDEVEDAVQMILAGKDPAVATATARDELAAAQKRELALIRVVEVRQQELTATQRIVVRDVQESLQGYLNARIVAVATAVSELGAELESLGDFLRSAAEAGAPFSDSQWGVVLGHVNDRNSFKLPKPEATRRSVNHYLFNLKRSFPDLVRDLAPLAAEWEH